MVDYKNPFDVDLFEEDSFIKVLPTTGVSTNEAGVANINLPPSNIPQDEVKPQKTEEENVVTAKNKLYEDRRRIKQKSINAAIEYSGKKNQTWYPQDKKSKLGYKYASHITDAVGFYMPKFIEDYGLNRLSMTATAAAAAGKFLMGEGPGKTFREAEMGQPISIFQLVELGFVGLDAVGANAALKSVWKSAVNGLSKLGKKPKYIANILREHPEMMDDFAKIDEGTPIEELSDVVREKLGVGASVPVKNAPTNPLKGKEILDPYLAPGRNTRTTTYTSAKNKRKKIDSVKNIEEFTNYSLLPGNTFSGQSINPARLKVVRKYAKIMNSGNAEKISALYVKVPAKERRALYQAAKRQGLITGKQANVAEKLYRQIATKKTLINDDLIIRAGNQFEKWKAGELPGVTTKGTTKSSMGAREFIRMLKDDPELDKLIGEEFIISEGTYEGPGKLKNLTNEERWLKNRIIKLEPIIYGLKEQTGNFLFVKPEALRTSNQIKHIGEPFGQAVRESIEISRLEANNQLKKAVQEKGGDLLKISKWAEKSSAWINKGAERLKDMGASPTLITNQLKKIDMDKLSDLIVQREKFNIERQFYNEELADVSKMFGDGELPFDAVQIGHFEAIEENIKRAMNIDNLFLQGWKANRAEQDLRKQVKNLKKKFREAKTGDEKRDAITKLMNIDKELAESGSISKIGGQDFGAWPDEDFLAVGEDVMDEMSFSKGGMAEDEIFEEQVSENRGTPTIDMAQESIFDDDNSYDTANLMVPFFKWFTKAPPNTTAPIPIPKPDLEEVSNLSPKPDGTLRPKQQTLKNIQEQETDFFDPTPDTPVMTQGEAELEEYVPLSITPYTNQPATGVVYSDIERVLSRSDTPSQFNSKKELQEFLSRNNIKKSELTDYRIESILKLYPDDQPITAASLISQVRQAPLTGARVHATGFNSKIINPQGYENARYQGYTEPGSLPGTYRERVLILPKNKLPGDSGDLPKTMTGEGDAAQRHTFGEGDENYVIGWSRLTDRMGYIPPKIAGPKMPKGQVGRLVAKIAREDAQLKGLFAEAQSKLHRRGMETDEGFNQADIDELTMGSIEDILRFKDQLDEISPGLVDQIDEIIVSKNKSQSDINKLSTADSDNYVKVTFADEIQSDILQEAARRKQYLGQFVKRLEQEGQAATNLDDYQAVNQKLLAFYNENKSVFRPQAKTAAEVDVLGQQFKIMDDQIDNIINTYVATREISEESLGRLQTLLQENTQEMLQQISKVDSNTMGKLFPDIPFKNREDWSDAIIKNDLFEAAYRKFILKDPTAADYYAISPSSFVKTRYGHAGGTYTPNALRAKEKKRQLDYFMQNGEMTKSELTGVGMDEFYGGPEVKSPLRYFVYDTTKPIKEKMLDINGKPILKKGKPEMVTVGYKKVSMTDIDGKTVSTTENNSAAKEFIEASNNPNYKIDSEQPHYKGVLEKILKKQAKENNSVFTTMPIQTKASSKNVYIVTDQNGNMVATLSNGEQADSLVRTNPNYRITEKGTPEKKDMSPVFAIKITKEMLEPYVTHKAMGGLVEDIDIFEV